MNAIAELVPVEQNEASGPTRKSLKAAIEGACRKIAPLWPLKHFVAVNPFLGFSNQSFHATCATLRRVARVNMLMPRTFYREALQSGFIEDQDLTKALTSVAKDWRAPSSVFAFKQALASDPSAM